VKPSLVCWEFVVDYESAGGFGLLQINHILYPKPHAVEIFQPGILLLLVKGREGEVC
jgi:hypothetical protein